MDGLQVQPEKGIITTFMLNFLPNTNLHHMYSSISELYTVLYLIINYQESLYTISCPTIG